MSSTLTPAMKPAETLVSEAPRASGLLQRKCACGGNVGPDGESSECKKKKLIQRRVEGGTHSRAVPEMVHQVINRSGIPLDKKTQREMGYAFGSQKISTLVSPSLQSKSLEIGDRGSASEMEAEDIAAKIARSDHCKQGGGGAIRDFGQIRIHHDVEAARSAAAVGAAAYTVGNHIVFGSSRFNPETRHGRNLLAHELTHTVQQQYGQVLQRGGDDRCGGGGTCAASAQCVEPDPGFGGSPSSSTSWQMVVKIDVEESSFEDALRSHHVGHTYVQFLEGNGRQYTYGFYPAGAIPNENVRNVLGCVRHPDRTHASCIDDNVTFTLSHDQYQSALNFAQNLCRIGHSYGVNYTCTTYASEVASAAGQSLPSSRSEPMTIYYHSVPPIDNPNTLLENVTAARQRDAMRLHPFWNNPCLNRCEAEFERCFRNSSSAGSCIARRSTCISLCPRPTSARP
jgi:Domain of unknown function (DUF4157)